MKRIQPMDGRLFILFLLLSLALAGCGRETAASSAPAAPPLPTLDAVQVAQGRAIYAQRCAACHGLNNEGAPGWPTPAADGLPPAPPHNDSGHTWHHADRVLYAVIRDGMGDPLRPDSPLRMPAFGEQLSDGEIRALIEYFKSLWTDENRRYQQEETRKDFAPTPTPY